MALVDGYLHNNASPEHLLVIYPEKCGTLLFTRDEDASDRRTPFHFRYTVSKNHISTTFIFRVIFKISSSGNKYIELVIRCIFFFSKEL